MSARRFLAEIERLIRAANGDEAVEGLLEPEKVRERERVERAQHFLTLEQETLEAEEVIEFARDNR